MTALGNAWIAGWLTARALFHWLMPAAYLPTLLVAPALQVAFFGIVIVHSGREPAGTVTGLVLASSSLAGLYGGLMVVAGDRWQATLEPVSQTGLPTGLRLLGRLTPIACHAALTGMVLLTGATLLQIVPLRPVLIQVALLACAGCVAVSALGLLAGTVGLLVRDAFAWGGVLFLVLHVSSGALLPRAELPGPVRTLTSVAPLSHSVEAARDIVRGHGSLADTMTATGWELAVATGLVLVTTATYRWFEIVAARTGRLAFV